MSRFKILIPFLLVLCVLVAKGQHSFLSQAQKPTNYTLIKPDTIGTQKNTGINNAESIIRYNQGILKNDFDFNLTPVAKGKFKLNIVNDTKALVFIKVYDIIGNLIYQEQIRIRGGFNKDFDLSFSKSDFFVVQIGNSNYNKSKTIVAAL